MSKYEQQINKKESNFVDIDTLASRITNSYLIGDDQSTKDFLNTLEEVKKIDDVNVRQNIWNKMSENKNFKNTWENIKIISSPAEQKNMEGIENIFKSQGVKELEPAA